MRALGFCVGVEHARYLASQFVAVSIAARGGVGGDPGNGTSRGALNALRCAVSPADRERNGLRAATGPWPAFDEGQDRAHRAGFCGAPTPGVPFRPTIPRPDRTWPQDLKRQVKHDFPVLPSGSQIVLGAKVAGRVGYHDVGAFHATFVKHTG